MRTAASMVLVLALALPAGAEHHLTLQQVPEAVRATIKREAEGAKIGHIEREREHGQEFYEAEIIRNGVKSYIHVGDDGRVLEHEPAAKEEKTERR